MVLDVQGWCVFIHTSVWRVYMYEDVVYNVLTHVRVVGICICKCVSGVFARMKVLGVSVYEHVCR